MAEKAKRQRRPIAVATHSEPHPHTDGFIRVLTLLYDDGSVWIGDPIRGWKQVQTLPGDEETK